MSPTRRLAAPTAIAIAALIALTGCGFVAASKKSDTKPGAFVLTGDATVPLAGAAEATGAPCTAPIGFADVAEHTEVIVTDAHAKKVATGRLGPGVVAASGSGYACEFPFTIRGVPDGSDVYNVAIGNRPAQSFQATALRTNSPAVIAFGG